MEHVMVVMLMMVVVATIVGVRVAIMEKLRFRSLRGLVR